MTEQALDLPTKQKDQVVNMLLNDKAKELSNLVPHDYDPETGETEVDDSDCNSPQQKKLWSAYSEGGSVGIGKLSVVK